MKNMWEDLPGDLLVLIADKLIGTNYIRFGAVCVSWRSACIECKHRSIEFQPVLMIPTKDNVNQQTRSFYSLAERRVYDFQLPLPHNKRCRGSSQGWLLIVDENNEAMQLLNPFSTLDNKIELPQLTELLDLIDGFDNELDEALWKTVLSANPTLTTNYVVMVIYGACYGRLTFFKPGDKVWTSLDPKWKLFDDIIYYKDQFYAVNELGEVVSCDVRPLHPIVTKVPAPPPLADYRGYRAYLVESSGDLLQVVRERNVEYDDEDHCTWSTVGFQVFKLDRIGPKWVEVKSLCNRMIFLGDNSSMSLSALDFPGCKPNCIYFTDDNPEVYYSYPPYWPHDMGIFNLEDGSFEPHYCPAESEIIMPPPIWVGPMQQGCCN